MINTQEEFKERQRWLKDFFLDCRQVEGFNKALEEDRFNTYKDTYETVKKPKIFNQLIVAKFGREENAQKWCFDVEEVIKELEEYRDRNKEENK